MKKFTRCIQLFLLVCLSIASKTVYSQSPCSATFSYNLNPGGNVSFTSTSTTTSSSTSYSWSVQSYASGAYSTAPSGLNSSYTFSTNGTYKIILSIINSAPACSASTQQTIVVTNTNTPCGLNASFSLLQGNNGTVTLTSQSTGTVGGTTYSWNFGDNSTGTGISAVHTYSADGLYLATLIANNNYTYSCTSSIVNNIQICSISPPNASFIFSPNPGGNVTFTSTSTGTNSGTFYTWNHYGTGVTSSGVNLTQSAATYSLNGPYITMLQIVNPLTNCSSSFSQAAVVTNTTCALIANFQFNQVNNGFVNFSSTSTGTSSGTSYTWNFGDNTTGFNAATSHTYLANGPYTVTLTAVNNFPNFCSSVKTRTVLVCNIQPHAIASFTSTFGTNGNVTFTSTSTGTVSSNTYHWLFYGVGSTSIYNAGWNLAGTGSYSSGVNLTQSAITFTNNGSTIVIMEIVDAVSTCTYNALQTYTFTNLCVSNASFSLSPTGTPQYWNAVPLSVGNVTAAVWSWGDGSTSNTLYTSHTYSAAGTYSICLTVTVSCGAVKTYCNSYYVYRGSGANQDQDVIQVNVIDPATVGINNYENKTTEFAVSPNPNNGSFNLKMNGLNGHNVELNIYDITGKIIYHENVQTIDDNLTREIQLDQVPGGIYYLKANSDTKMFTKKIVINP